MSLVHTLLFFIRCDHYTDDLTQAKQCLKSLSQSTYKKLVIYNQGGLSNNEVRQLVGEYDLECFILGDGTNVGIVAGRQKCFEFIWNELPDSKYVSELHVDMIFPDCWENKLIDYLESNDEPMISCGIVDSCGYFAYLEEQIQELPQKFEEWSPFLQELRRDVILPGFAHPCIHVMKALRDVGGYDLEFLKGNQCFEDDSLLLSYYLYYGTRTDWFPKINYNSVVYHGVAMQRLGLDNCMLNYIGLIQQYGLIGLKYLSKLHSNPYQKQFFERQFNFLSGTSDD